MTQKREAANKKWQNARTLLQVWYKKRHKFWRASTKLLMNIGAVSSQGSEVTNYAIKSTDTALTSTQLIEKTKHMSERHFFVQLQAIDRARNTVKLQRGSDNWTEVLQSELSIFAVEWLTQQLALSHRNQYRFVSGSDGTVTDSTKSIRIDMANNTCCCGFMKQYGLLCRHMMSLLDEEMKHSPCSARRERLAQACLTHAHMRWCHNAQFHVLGLKNPGAVAQRAPTSAVDIINEAADAHLDEG